MQRSWKQLIRWLDAPRFVSAGEDIQAVTTLCTVCGDGEPEHVAEVLTCYNDHQVSWSLFDPLLVFHKSTEVNVEDIYLPREMVDKYQEATVCLQGTSASAGRPKHSLGTGAPGSPGPGRRRQGVREAEKTSDNI